MNPSFDKNITEYSVITSNATNKITATAENDSAVVSVFVNGEEFENGNSASWKSGNNTVTVTVDDGGIQTVYTVTVMKE